MTTRADRVRAAALLAARSVDLYEDREAWARAVADAITAGIEAALGPEVTSAKEFAFKLGFPPARQMTEMTNPDIPESGQAATRDKALERIVTEHARGRTMIDEARLKEWERNRFAVDMNETLALRACIAEIRRIRAENERLIELLSRATGDDRGPLE